MGFFSELDMYLFGQGTHYDVYQKMGAHIQSRGKKTGVCFDVWAPHANRVWVIGEFNGWNEYANEMERLEPEGAGVYELFIEGAKEGQLYKYVIETKDHERLYKADPYAFYAELRPGTASRIADLSTIRWTDKKWMDKREDTDPYRMPMSIYEVHPGSWMRHPGREDDGFYTYRELAKALTDYVKDMGYTHVELMGIAEYPYDGSWGYQVTGYYAPTSRYGSPEDFAYLINYLHKNNIGVILDWVPAHFPRDAHGLCDFDGEPLYEYPDPRMGEHPDWGTKIFNYGMNQVKNFLIGSALMWTEFYHVDGLRVDAVASMLYLDYGKKDGEWVANKYGENKNLDAVEFFRHLNTLITGRNKGTIMIAEESTAWPNVTGGVEDSAYSLAFSYKWNMGWMHDFLDYMKLDPLYRKGSHNKMTFAMSYNSSENYILVLSHDEVVHLKCSMIEKMPGVGRDRFLNLMAGYTYMFGHPGKKLLFMGQDFGQYHEWDEKKELDWYLIGSNKDNNYLKEYVKELLHLYKSNRALYEWDRNWGSFDWINADDAYRSIFSFVRKSEDGKNNLLFVINFTPVEYDDYRVGVPGKKKLKLVLDSDDERFGGNGKKKKQIYTAEKKECDNLEYSIAYPLSPYGIAVFKY
ncbi:MAG: 1,4-alpha-glucan branching protein GlgB [Lachnospiraceae bacterium]|nr:1,4-alpha-glucan branching protein GlgB [Lachnospiraceae bacterium]